MLCLLRLERAEASSSIVNSYISNQQISNQTTFSEILWLRLSTQGEILIDKKIEEDTMLLEWRWWLHSEKWKRKEFI